MILPFSPEPFTSAKFIPLSVAIFFASGDAKMRPSEVLFITTVVSVSSTLVFALVSFFSEVVLSAGALAPPLATIAVTSVPAGPMIVNKLSTGAVSPS